MRLGLRYQGCYKFWFWPESVFLRSLEPENPFFWDFEDPQKKKNEDFLTCITCQYLLFKNVYLFYVFRGKNKQEKTSNITWFSNFLRLQGGKAPLTPQQGVASVPHHGPTGPWTPFRFLKFWLLHPCIWNNISDAIYWKYSYETWPKSSLWGDLQNNVTLGVLDQRVKVTVFTWMLKNIHFW